MIKKTLKRHAILLGAFAISLLLLTVFLTFQYYQSPVLGLDVKWIILCGVPVLIGLFAGGYIKTFKGFGVELESNLKETIPVSLISKAEVVSSKSMTKESVFQLNEIPEEQKLKINRLQFLNGLKNHYENFAVGEHVRQLKQLKFIEILDANGGFLYVMPVAVLKGPDEHVIDWDKQTKFIKAIEEGNIPTVYPDVVTDHLKTTDNLVEGYRKISRSTQNKILLPSKETLPILNDKNRMVGIVNKQRLEARIAEAVEKNLD